VNNEEARIILAAQLDNYRAWSYDQLVAIVGAPKQVLQVAGADGATYYVDIRAIWDGEAGGDVRLMACIDDGGWRAFAPLTDSFIKEPHGTGESTPTR
jgi:hypothetical protein